MRNKSQRQKKIERHARTPKLKKYMKWVALFISAIVVSIPVYLKLMYE